MQSRAIRSLFLKYFQGLAHEAVPSARLIPEGDATLFFVNAGMVPFKRIFTGEEVAPYRRAVSSQKCLRVSGKHNDLENVGVTIRHHTFFEMLGNFSFGDYFKQEATQWAWAFLTEQCRLPAERLWVTVYQDDDEAAEIWKKNVGVSADRILRLGEADNFWSMGPTGPCGPCSEIHIDRGGPCSLGNRDCGVTCDCDRFMEIWNLVFMQFNRDEAGVLHPLPKPSIDTGMGLERLAMVLQGKSSNYETDLFSPIIEEICTRVGKPYGKDRDTDISIQVLADHIRAASFLISDGVLPNNEGRGYVLRRILRRAIRHGNLLGMKEPFFYRLHAVLAREMGDAYPELRANADFVEKVISQEETRFLETLDRGMALLEAEMKKLAKGSFLSGDVAFRLYDTYGFPADLTELILKQAGFSLDWPGFDKAMDMQREKGREAWRGSGASHAEKGTDRAESALAKTEFCGYDCLSLEGKVLALFDESGAAIKEAKPGTKAEIVLDRTPFYPEGGGQRGDRGEISKRGPDGKARARFKVRDTARLPSGIIVHRGEFESGSFAAGDGVTARVDSRLRGDTMKNHTATHLLHAALRKHAGAHVKQAGSLVEEKRLRFDFNHFEVLTADQIRAIEDEVNEEIRRDSPVNKAEMAYAEATARGALAFFGEKYGDTVRVVEVPGYSTELCGGTHVDRTGEIGLFKIVSESGIASGVRRIEAVTGREALTYLRHLEDLCARASEVFKASRDEIPERLAKLQARAKQLERENAALKAEIALGGSRAGSSGAPSWKEAVVERGGVSILFYETALDDPEVLRRLSDDVKAGFAKGVALLVGKGTDKVLLIALVGKTAPSTFHAGKIIQALAPLVGGKGGGRPDFAQGGGGDVVGAAGLRAAFEAFIQSFPTP